MWWSLTLSDCSSVNLCFQSINQVSKCKYILSYLNIQSTADSHLWATASRHSIWHHSHPFLVTCQTNFSIWTYRECLSEENPQSAEILQQNKELLIRPVNDNTSLCLSLHLFIYLFIYLSIYLSICLSVHPFVCLSICPYICPSICLSLHLSIYLSICPSICLSLHLSIYLSICPSICLSFHPRFKVLYYSSHTQSYRV